MGPPMALWWRIFRSPSHQGYLDVTARAKSYYQKSAKPSAQQGVRHFKVKEAHRWHQVSIQKARSINKGSKWSTYGNQRRILGSERLKGIWGLLPNPSKIHTCTELPTL
jgi:hypothetical protein